MVKEIISILNTFYELQSIPWAMNYQAPSKLTVHLNEIFKEFVSIPTSIGMNIDSSFLFLLLKYKTHLHLRQTYLKFLIQQTCALRFCLFAATERL